MLRNATQFYAGLRRFTQVYAGLRNISHVTHVTHDYADLLMLRNEYQWLRNYYAIITQWLCNDYAYSTIIYALLRNITHVT